MKRLPYFLILSILISACSEQAINDPVQKARLDNPSTSTKIRTLIAASFFAIGQTFKINSKKKEVIVTDKGSRVSIPENAFVLKADGTPVEGMVDLTFTEYSNRGEIIASGIPMTFTDENGVVQNFESAGMFEIEATQNGQDLELARGKEIKVELATDVDGPFNFYQLNEQRETWALKDTDCKPIPNPYIKETEQRIEEVEKNIRPAPRKPVKYTPGDALFDVRLNKFDYSIISDMNGVMWKYSGTDTKMDPARIGAFDAKYKFVYLEPTEQDFLEYTLVFETTDKKELRVNAVPIFQGKLLDRENDRMAKIIRETAEATKERKKLLDQLKREKELLRVFSVGSLAVYNWDMYYTDPKVKVFEAVFALEGQASMDNVSFYLLPSDRRIVIQYYSGSFENFAINPSIKNRVVAVAEDNTVFALSSSDIKALKLEGRLENSKVPFNLKRSGKIEDPTKLEAFIQSL